MDGGPTFLFPGVRPVVERAAELPVAALVTGKPVGEVADLLPRLFNLCRAAQSACARRAFGLPETDGDRTALAREILRDHLLKLNVTWAGHYGRSAATLPANWATDGEAVARALFGAPGVMPAAPDDFESFLRSGTGVAGILATIDASFGPGEADTGWLPALTTDTAFGAAPVENSIAGRHALHPVMRRIAETRGHGPLWRATARAFDVTACLADRLPVPREAGPGRAIVAATRGSYAVQATVEDGKVTSFARTTPTDHLMANGGILDRTLASLPEAKHGYLPLILDILDPCTPIRIRGTAHA